MNEMDIANDIYTIIIDKNVAGENIIELSNITPFIAREDLDKVLKLRGTPLDMYRYYKNPDIYIRDIGEDSTETVCSLGKVELIYHMLDSTWNLACQGESEEDINKIIDEMEEYTFPYLIYTLINKLKSYSNLDLISINLIRDKTGVNSIIISFTNTKVIMIKN